MIRENDPSQHRAFGGIEDLHRSGGGKGISEWVSLTSRDSRKSKTPFFFQTNEKKKHHATLFERTSRVVPCRPSVHEGNIRAVVVVSPPLARPSDERFDSILLYSTFACIVSRDRPREHNEREPFCYPVACFREVRVTRVDSR